MNLPVLDKLNPDVAALNPYEPGRPIEEVAREMGLNVNEIVKLASNESAIGTSPKAIAALQAALPESYRYPDGGAWHLRNKLAVRYSVTRDQIAVGNGSNEILELVGHCFMTPGTSAVFSAHAFIVYKLVAQLFGIEQREIPMTDGLVHDLEAMLAAIDETTTVVFVCNPNNPTGTMAANDAIVDFMSRVPDHVLVVFDEAYAEIALSEMPDTMQYVHAERRCCKRGNRSTSTCWRRLPGAQPWMTMRSSQQGAPSIEQDGRPSRTPAKSSGCGSFRRTPTLC
jgi:histidinol-phosphate aminotransferase